MENTTMNPSPSRKRWREDEQPLLASSSLTDFPRNVRQRPNKTPPGQIPNANIAGITYNSNQTPQTTSPISTDSESEDLSSASSSEDSSEVLSEDDSEDASSSDRLPAESTYTPPLAARLSAFLPQLAAANAELETERASGGLKARAIDINLERGLENGSSRPAEDEEEEEDDAAEEDAQGGESMEGNGMGMYVEMNLGLGVLEEKTSEVDDAESRSESENDEDEEVSQTVMGAADHSSAIGAARLVSKPRNRERDILGRLLMGQRRKIGRGQIQEVGG